MTDCHVSGSSGSDGQPRCVVDEDGIREWFLNDRLHREDGPAIERPDGSKFWYVNGEPHRDVGPAVVLGTGAKAWFVHGVRHRVDGPAVMLSNGDRSWWLFDCLTGEGTVERFRWLPPVAQAAVRSLLDSGADLEEAVAVAEKLAE